MSGRTWGCLMPASELQETVELEVRRLEMKRDDTNRTIARLMVERDVINDVLDRFVAILAAVEEGEQDA